MRKVLLVLLAAAMTAGLISTNEALADGNIIVHRTSSVGFGSNCGLGYGNNWSWGPYSLNRSLGYLPMPPYYAMHPPVYYSHNVAVPYGMSPYPISSYSPSVSYVAERPIPEPQVVVNPYVDQDVASGEVPAEPAMKIVDADGKAVSAQSPKVVTNEF
ncbi:hypothetical protein Pan97_22030 [Bremerella volcania]|uniref:Uncharacterized protein n=1 Tax=Bremerella volcania TaxID=2527984 RepID=A0A518C7H3_9BACT|nr:hypothetical protein [Bremerella volcania]QDU75179.1 hypothetical protein Pan97_22030 [Bremerella volcania]